MALFRYSIHMPNPRMLYAGNPGGKVRLIKDLRGAFGIGLKEAKDIADEVERGDTINREYTICLTSAAMLAFDLTHGLNVDLIEAIQFAQDPNDIPMIFVVRKNSDMTEGRGAMLVDSAFPNRAAADEYIGMQYGIMGYKDGSGWDIKEMPLYSTAEQREASNIAEQKARALAKLTPFERSILGV